MTDSPEDPNQEVDSLLSSIEMEHTVSSLNDNDFIVKLPARPGEKVPQFMPLQVSDFTILPGGDLMFYKAYPCPHGETHPHQSICNVFARGEWISFERIESSV